MDRGVSIIEATIAPGADGWRLDRALADAVPTLSRERLKVLIAGGRVSRDGAPTRDPAKRAAAGETFAVAVPDPAPADNAAQDIPLTIAFEDEHLIVIDKPAGLVVHPAAGNLDGTLVNALLHHCDGSLSGIGGVARPGIVHRIDKDTSGLMVAARPTVRTRDWRGSSTTTASTGVTERSSEDTPPPPRAPSMRRSRAARTIARRWRSWRAASVPSPITAPSSGLRPPRWSNAGWKPAGPTRSASTWHRSAMPCWAIRPMVEQKVFTRSFWKRWVSTARRCTPRIWGSSIR